MLRLIIFDAKRSLQNSWGLGLYGSGMFRTRNFVQSIWMLQSYSLYISKIENYTRSVISNHL